VHGNKNSARNHCFLTLPSLTPDSKVEGLVSRKARGGSTPLGRIAKPLLTQGFRAFRIEERTIWRAPTGTDSVARTPLTIRCNSTACIVSRPMAPEPSSVDRADFEAALGRLENGPLHRFADFETVADLPREGAAIYTIWDDAGDLIYVGVSGRSATSTTGPWGRLRSHWNGRRSGDQFSVYVADHYVLPELSQEQVEAIAAKEPSLFMDDLVAAVIRERFSFRVVVVPESVEFVVP
jgi:hypothetical protein